MENKKKHTARKKIKASKEVIVTDPGITIKYSELIKIDIKLSDSENIHLIDAIMEKCPIIALKLIQILLTLSDK